MASFYKDFASCYGTLWLVMLALAIVNSTHINAGEFGLYGFPVVSAIYAAIRRPGRLEAERALAELRTRVFSLEVQLGQRE